MEMVVDKLLGAPIVSVLPELPALMEIAEAPDATRGVDAFNTREGVLIVTGTPPGIVCVVPDDMTIEPPAACEFR